MLIEIRYPLYLLWYLVIIFGNVFWLKLRTMKCRCQNTSTDEPKTKMNLFDNASNLLTNLLSGGKIGSMPIAEGAVTDLFDRPLFFSLYDWFLKVIALVCYSLLSLYSCELSCSDSSFLIRHQYRTLQKYTSLGESDTHSLTFLKSLEQHTL